MPGRVVGREGRLVIKTALRFSYLEFIDQQDILVPNIFSQMYISIIKKVTSPLLSKIPKNYGQLTVYRIEKTDYGSPWRLAREKIQLIFKKYSKEKNAVSARKTKKISESKNYLSIPLRDTNNTL